MQNQINCVKQPNLENGTKKTEQNQTIPDFQPIIRRIKLNVRNLIITLLGSDLKINRKFIVPDNMNLFQLHKLIQLTMPWNGEHQYDFNFGNIRWLDKNNKFAYKSSGTANYITNNWSIAKLNNFTKGKNVIYEYDFGDSWMHELAFGESVEAKSSECYPKLLEANGVCPPEDCGGIIGYYQLLEILSNPKHPDHEEYKEYWEYSIDCNAEIIPKLDGIVEYFAKNFQNNKQSPR